MSSVEGGFRVRAIAPFALIVLQSLAVAATDDLLTDQLFVTRAAQAGDAEVGLAQLAVRKGGDARVRSFAERMLRDHREANQLLQAVSQRHGWKLPSEMDRKHQQLTQELRRLKGRAFDQAYAKAVEQDHDDMVALFSQAVHTEGLNTDLLTVAERTLPTLRDHERRSDDLKYEETHERGESDGK